MRLFQPNESTLRRYSLALLGLSVVAAKAAGAHLTSEDLMYTLGFLTATILSSNAKAIADTHMKKTKIKNTVVTTKETTP